MEDNFERLKNEFWLRHNRSKRFGKKLIVETLRDARISRKNLTTVLEGESIPESEGELFLIAVEEGYDFGEIIKKSKKVMPSLYRRYQKDADKCKVIYNDLN